MSLSTFYHPILARDFAEIERKLSALLASQSLIIRTLYRLEIRMSDHSAALAALAAAEAKLSGDVTTETTTLSSLGAEIEALRAQLASTPEDDTATITALTAQLADLDARINAAQAAAQGELPANPAAPTLAADETPAPATPGNPSSGGVAVS